MKLIAESGSTKTKWGLMSSGELLRTYEGIGLNPWIVDEDSLSKEFLEVKKALGLEDEQLDVALALFGKEKGIVCILGTGSNVAYYDGDSFSQVVPSLGYVLGDEGSGNHLGKMLLKAYAEGKLSNKLSRDLEKEFNLESVSDILNQVYKKPFPNRFLASFSTFLHRNKGDEVIDKILKKVFTDFMDVLVVPTYDYSNSKIGIVGSVGWFYKEEITSVLSSKNISVNVLLRDSFDGLVNTLSKRGEQNR